MSTLVLFDGLYAQIRDILQAARQRSYRAVNVAMIEAYWQIGRQIVEHEQAGEHRAAYGQRVLAELAKELSKEFGKGFTAGNLRNFRQFYQTFSQEEICDALRSTLTWTHYRQLMFKEQYRGVDDNSTLGLILCSERNAISEGEA